MGVFVTLTTEKWAMREVEDGRRFGGGVWFWRKMGVVGKNLLSHEEMKSERGASGMHPRSIVGASLEHAWSMQGAYMGVWRAGLRPFGEF